MGSLHVTPSLRAKPIGTAQATGQKSAIGPYAYTHSQSLHYSLAGPTGICATPPPSHRANQPLTLSGLLFP